MWHKPGFLVRFSLPRAPWRNELVLRMAPGTPDPPVLSTDQKLSLGPREQALVSQSRGTQPMVVPGNCGQLALPQAWPQSRRWVWSTARGEGEVGKAP